jgi:hypothetical protein
MFTEYPGIPGVPDVESTGNEMSRKKDWKRKLAKRVKKQNKLIAKLIDLQEQRAVNPVVASEAVSAKSPSFLKKLGDAVLKAVPTVLKTFISVAATSFFSRFFGERNKSSGKWFGRVLAGIV